MAANANRAVPEWIAYAKDMFAPLKMEIARQKMAGLEYGPANRRSKPSEGNTVQRNGRKPPNDFTFLGLFRSLGDEWHSKKQVKRQKFVRR
ncbi:hypothetical protein [Mesorhizobium sp. M0491]|uniref:hypothetical protein n=1 Tax=unclassified Mesorhizobium TaxID=325217 RepID=UPI00333D1CA0